MKYTETTYLMKKRLAGALYNALQQKSFAKITVSDIVDSCAVNRKTFYYHFSDIHELLRWMFAEEFRDLMQPYDMLNDYTSLANSVMDYVEQNERLFFNIVNTVGEDGLKHALYEEIRELQSRIVNGFEIQANVQFEREFRAFLVKFLSDAIVGILMEWIQRRRYRYREKTIDYLRDIFRAAIPSLIERRVHLDDKKIF